MKNISKDKHHVEILTKHRNFKEINELYNSLKSLIKLFNFGNNNRPANDVEELINTL